MGGRRQTSTNDVYKYGIVKANLPGCLSVLLCELLMTRDVPTFEEGLDGGRGFL